MSEDFDPTLYVRAPFITVPSGVSLAFALIDACPRTPPPPLEAAGGRAVGSLAFTA